jgi:hypothetical protein
VLNNCYFFLQSTMSQQVRLGLVRLGWVNNNYRYFFFPVDNESAQSQTPPPASASSKLPLPPPSLAPPAKAMRINQKNSPEFLTWANRCLFKFYSRSLKLGCFVLKQIVISSCKQANFLPLFCSLRLQEPRS